jgi:hypothetical protein
MKILTGTSLHRDDPALFKQVEKLIQTRNRLAHRGEVPDSKTTTECVRAAFGAFRWLDALGPGSS